MAAIWTLLISMQHVSRHTYRHIYCLSVNSLYYIIRFASILTSRGQHLWPKYFHIHKNLISPILTNFLPIFDFSHTTWIQSLDSALPIQWFLYSFVKILHCISFVKSYVIPYNKNNLHCIIPYILVVVMVVF